MNNLLTKHILEDLSNRERFRQSLLEWYDENQRELPWRTDPSLYKTVISEFMLQQTRVSTVLPYFQKWIIKFPDFPSLAQAKEEDILKGWEGLGYYSRARNLHKLSQIISTQESIPHDVNFWKSLPGIGPYIAAAVTSISFNQKEAVCDGNVVRVLTRFFGNGEKFKDGAYAQKKLQPLAHVLMPDDRTGDYNQAFMELGATVCHRQSPRCTTCPVLKFCKCGQRGDAENFPVMEKKKKTVQEIDRLWIKSSNALLLQKGKMGNNRLAGIYELPLNTKLGPYIKGKFISLKKRTIGQVLYKESIYWGSISKTLELDEYSLEWVQWKDIEEITISGPHRKWIKEIIQSIEPDHT